MVCYIGWAQAFIFKSSFDLFVLYNDCISNVSALTSFQ